MPIRRTNMDNMIETINSYAKKDGLKISSNVITAIKEVPRNLFVRKNPFDDSPQLIGWNQTISQPYIVAYMTEMLDVKPSHRVLDVGMGSGYQSAILSKLVKEVYAIEIIKELAEKTREVLQDYKNIKTGIRNGYDGWEKYAPYDRIMVAAKTNQVPNKLFNQLVNNGKMIIPLIEESKEKLGLITKGDYNSFVKETLIGVRFVPLVGG